LGSNLPNELETAAARNTAQFAYYATLCLLEARVLYSKMKVSELLDPTHEGQKDCFGTSSSLPRKYLQRIGVREKRLINQVANYALVEWSDNIKISDRAPRDYVPELEKRFASDELQQMYDWHGLPSNWYELDYEDFLKERRRRIALIIKSGFERLVVGV